MTVARRTTLYFLLVGIIISGFSLLLSLSDALDTKAIEYALCFLHGPIIFLSLRFDIPYVYLQAPLGVVYFTAIGFLIGTILESSRRKYLHLSFVLALIIFMHIAAAVVVTVEYEEVMQDIQELSSFVDNR